MQTMLDLTVRELDVHDDAAMQRWHAVVEAADAFERPWATTWSLPEMLAHFRSPDDALRWLPLGAFDGGEMVGAATVVLPLQDNLEKTYGEVFVEPERRGHGIGSALVEGILERMRAEARSVLIVDAGIPGDRRGDHPYARFALRHGFTMANVEVHRVLDLPVETSVLEAMAAEAAPYHEGYRIRTFEDGVPEELLDSYLVLLSQLAVDAPTGEIDFEEEKVTRETHAQHLQKLRDQGRRKLVTLAVSPDGEAVAHSDLVVPAHDMPKAYQWGTLVRRDHRGHHLGAATKVANLLALQARFPERTEVHTTNAETNATMIGINERLGFRVVEICPEFMLRL